MSIINDALKKTQQNFNKQKDQDISSLYEKLHTKPRAESPESPSDEKTPAPQKSNPKKIFLLFLSIAAIAFLLSFLLITFFSKSPSKYKSVAKIKSMVDKETAKFIKPPEPKRTYEKNELFLNGTMQMEGKTIALINDQIYEVGDSVNGKKITDIRLDGVELLDGQQKIFLTVH